MELTRGQLEALLIFSADAPMRYQLHAVHFNGSKNKAITTDGKGMLIVESETEIGDHIVDRAELTALTKVMRAKKEGALKIEEKKSTLDPVATYNGTTEALKHIDANYPNYEYAWPKSKPESTVTVSLPLLEKLVKAIKTSGGTRVTLNVRGKQSALDFIITSDGQKVKGQPNPSPSGELAKGLIMPMIA